MEVCHGFVSNRQVPGLLRQHPSGSPSSHSLCLNGCTTDLKALEVAVLCTAFCIHVPLECGYRKGYMPHRNMQAEGHVR